MKFGILVTEAWMDTAAAVWWRYEWDCKRFPSDGFDYTEGAGRYTVLEIGKDVPCRDIR